MFELTLQIYWDQCRHSLRFFAKSDGENELFGDGNAHVGRDEGFSNNVPIDLLLFSMGFSKKRKILLVVVELTGPIHPLLN